MDRFELGVGALLVTAAAVFAALQALAAPYGRHARPGWGPTVGPRAGWVCMEAPAALVFAAVYAAGTHAAEPAPLVFLGLWLAHYGERAFVYPLRMRGSAPIPWLVVGLGASFNAANATLNARWVSELGAYPPEWLHRPTFWVGAALFGVGYALNRHADAVLRALRAPGDTGYRIPRGGAFRWVSCPNYLGELLAWAGWALATASPAGLAFAVFTAANLVPRAGAHHRWYRATFPDYPPERRALVPFVW